MRYGSVCSGIEAATMAWHPLGWTPTFFSEIEAFPSAVLAHHYGSNMPDEASATNGVPNHGDMTKFEEWPDHAIDLLVGGTPCQSFSIAGLRGGLDDARGNLMLTYGAIARRYRPRWLVWENVFGVFSSDGGRDFGSLLGLLSGRRVQVPRDGWRNAGIVPGYQGAYGLAWRVLDTQYVRVDGFGMALPQRRRRVIVVGYLGDWRRAAAVLLELEGLRGDSAPRRDKGKRNAPTVSTGTRGVGDFELGGGLVGGFDYENNAHGPDEPTGPLLKGSPSGGGYPLPAIVSKWPAEVAPTLDTYYGDKMGLEDQHIFNQHGGKFVPAPIAFAQNTRDEVRLFGGDGQTVGALAAEPGIKQQSYVASPTPTAWSIMPQNSGKDYKAREVDVAQPIMAGGPVGGNQGGDYIQTQWAVRRLTPRECERLQGFPDDFTLVPHRNKPAADGPRYKALGNTMSVNVMRWIGRRIEMVEKITKGEAA